MTIATACVNGFLKPIFGRRRMQRRLAALEAAADLAAGARVLTLLALAGGGAEARAGTAAEAALALDCALRRAQPREDRLLLLSVSAIALLDRHQVQHLLDRAAERRRVVDHDRPCADRAGRDRGGSALLLGAAGAAPQLDDFEFGLARHGLSLGRTAQVARAERCAKLGLDRAPARSLRPRARGDALRASRAGAARRSWP